MITITAIIRARPGAEDIVRDALLAVTEAVRETEPATIGYCLSQSVDDPCLFTTYERFADRGAMEKHNTSEALARFIREAGPHLDGDIVVHVGQELSVK